VCLCAPGDGVGYGWIDSLKAHAEKKVSDQEYENARHRFPYNTPATKEAYYFRAVFEGHFPQQSARGQLRTAEQVAVIAVVVESFLTLPSFLFSLSAECVPGGPSIACSTPTALLWDESFKRFADCSGRSVAGVHTAAYDAQRRDQAKGEAVKEEVLAKVGEIVLPGQAVKTA
jgi:asparagine synthase (glutamine-hydrolysing)